MLTVVGGVYVERCIEPSWDQVFGSGGRAAAAAVLLSERVLLKSYIGKSIAGDAAAMAAAYGFSIEGLDVESTVEFSYFHSLSTPVIYPPVGSLKYEPIRVSGEIVLRFGMLEGDAVVDAECAVYDPQSAFSPARFSENGSTARRLAIILNSSEALRITGESDPSKAAIRLRDEEKAAVVVVKMGGHGALVSEVGRDTLVPAFQSDFVWKIGSGDVFTAVFAVLWGEKGADARDAAVAASRATALYCGTRSLPIPAVADLLAAPLVEVRPVAGRVYLAGPFFDLGQRWLVEESRRQLGALGAEVFSPLHEIGHGAASEVAPADLAALASSDSVFAILNGLDSGTVFELGYAVARGKPVVALAQNMKEEDLKMIVGSGCRVFDDFVTALYHSIWSIRK